MAINTIGSTIRIFGTLLVNDVPTDPTSLRIEIEDPTGTITNYEYGTDPEVVRDSVGQFHFDLQLTQYGTWLFRWYSNSSLTAFQDGEIEVADLVTISTVDATVAAIPFVTLQIYDSTAAPVNTGISPQRTGSDGTLDVQLPDDAYRISASKLGWVFDPIVVDIVGDGPHAITLTGRTLTTRWLLWEDLETVVDKSTIDRLFQNDNTGYRDMQLIESVIQGAETLAESRLLRSWSQEQIVSMASVDSALRQQAAWLALEMASERRQEFIAADGKGRYWAQYERAIDYFDSLSKSKSHSRGEALNPSANTGGARRPVLDANQDPFVFAPGRNGRGPGGF